MYNIPNILYICNYGSNNYLKTELVHQDNVMNLSLYWLEISDG